MSSYGVMVSSKQYKSVFANAWRWWNEDHVPRLAAALTFYAMLSLAPMILLAVVAAGYVLGQEAARAGVLNEIRSSVGQAQAAFVESLLAKPGGGASIFASVFSVAALLFGASGLFEQLRDSVNAIWGLESKSGGFLAVLRRKAYAFIGVSMAAILILAWLILDARIQWLASHSIIELPALWQMLSFLGAWLVSAVALAALFKYLPEKRLQWRDVWPAASFTALALALGKYVLTLYFAYASVAAAYGAAGALVVLLVWIYYSSQILFFGVELSNAYAFELGSLKGHQHDDKVSVAAAGVPDKRGPERDPRTGAAADTDANLGQAFFRPPGIAPSPRLKRRRPGPSV